MNLFKRLEEAIVNHSENNAFCINNVYYSYQQLAVKISGIRRAIDQTAGISERNIGLVTNDDLETYAAIIAIWLEGRCYVPLSPLLPIERNEIIIQQAGIKTLVDSSETSLFTPGSVINTNALSSSQIDVVPKPGIPGEQLVYIIFTSGSTGMPKGVQISINNLTAFIDSFFAIGIDINEEDRFLQMFELNFDLSIMSFFLALLKGACVYTIPPRQIKNNYIVKLLEEYGLTFAVMIPSVIQYLRPYFDEINCTTLKYNFFCGEALPLDVTEAWSHCVPNAKIINIYGPSEITIVCTHYLFDSVLNKTRNGILSVGKPMKGNTIIVIDQETGKMMEPGETGELCLAGNQLTHGYLNNEERNRQAFFYMDYEGRPERFYKTGDICLIDTEGDIMFVGRADSQVKIQGYRVELTEIEFHSKAFLKKANLVALAIANKLVGNDIALIVEGDPFNTEPLITYLKSKIPSYMIPARIKFEKKFPENSNGKIDRKVLLKSLQEQ